MVNDVKKTIIGLIPGDWKVKKIKDVCDTTSGGTPSRSNLEYYESGTIPWIKTGELNQKYIFDTEEKITEIAIQQSSAKLIPKNSVLMAMYGATIGKTSITKIEAATNQACCAMISKGEIEPEFLYYVLSYSKEKIISLGAGGAQPNISQQIIRELEIPFPLQEEQRKIAAILSSVDEAIEKTQAIIEQTEKVKKGLMQQLLTKGIGHTKFKKTEIGEIPEKWEVVKINDIFERVTRNNDLKDSYPILTISAKEGFVDQKERFNRVIAGRSLEKYILLHKGEFAYNRGNSKSYPFGVIYKLNDFEKGLVPFVYFCFRKKSNIEFNLDFYQYYFLSHKLDRQLRKIITSSARQDGLMNISADDFFNLLIPFPPKSEQEEIVKYIQSVDKRIKKEREKFETLILVKKGLMQSLLTGKVRVKVNEDEVVSS